MRKISLNDPNIGSFVDQSVSATMAQHMRVNIQMIQVRSRRKSANHNPHRASRKRFAPFADKKRSALSRRIHLFALYQPSLNGARLAIVQFMRSGIAELQPLSRLT